MPSRPLSGRSIVVTRAAAQASRLTRRLRDLGAEVVEIPTIEIVDPSDGGVALAAALDRLDQTAWLVLTSANGAQRVMGSAPDLPSRLEQSGARLAVIGPGTAQAFADHGLQPDLEPERFVAEGLLEVFPDPPSAGRARVVIAQAAAARPVLAEGLRAAGWDVEVVEAYRTARPRIAPELADSARGADVVTFTSASTVEGFVAGVDVDGFTPRVVCIGPITAEAARAAGLRVDAVADPHTIEGLVDAVVHTIGEAA